MPKIFALIGLMLFLMSQAGLVSAYPITTKYYSLDLPANWSVLKGPTRKKDLIFLQLANQKKTATATLVVGPASAAEAQQAPYMAASRANATVYQNQGQTEFSVNHGTEHGFCIFRYDSKSQLLLILTISGDTAETGFIFKIKSPHMQLRPVVPMGLKVR